MSGPGGVRHPEYFRPGISLMTAAFDHVDARDAVTLVRAVVNQVEQVIVAFVGTEIPDGLPKEPRLSVLATSQGEWGSKGQEAVTHQQLAQLCAHEWSLYLPPGAVPDPGTLASLRHRLARLGSASFSFRLGDAPREYATYYAQRVWRTAKRLRTDGAGNLLGLFTGARSTDNAVVDHDLRSHSAPAELPTSVAHWVCTPESWLVTGPSPTAVRAVSEAIEAHQDRQRAPHTDRTSVASELVAWCHEATAAAAGLPPSKPLDRGMFPELRIGSAGLPQGFWQHGTAVLTRLIEQAPAVAADPSLVLPLPGLLATWAAAGATACPRIVVAMVEPSDYARALQRREGVPLADGIRRYRQYASRVLELSRRAAGALSILWGQEPKQSFGGEHRTDGVQDQIHEWFPDLKGLLLGAEMEAALPGADSLPEVLRALSHEALDGEAEDVVKTHHALRALPRSQSSATATGPDDAPNHAAPDQHVPTMAAVLYCPGDVAALSDWLTAARLGCGAATLEHVTVLSPNTLALEPVRHGGDLPFALELEATGDDPEAAVARVLERTEQDLLFFSTTDAVPTATTFETHRKAHQLGRASGWILGNVAGSPLRDSDAPLLDHAKLGLCLPLPHPFPDNASIPTEVLRSLGTFQETGRRPHAFVESALVSAAQWGPPHYVDAPVTYRAPTGVHQFMKQQALVATTLVATVERHGLPFSRRELLERIRKTQALWAQRDALKEKRDKLVVALGAGGQSAPQLRDAYTKVLQAACHVSLLEGLLRGGVEVIRLMGTDRSLFRALGEHWNGLSGPARVAAFAAHGSRCQDLVQRHKGETIFVLGTGPQLGRLSPAEVQALANHTTVGVNDCHFVVRPRYHVSAYVSRVLVAQRNLGDSATILHMRPYCALPLLPGTLSVRRMPFEGELPAGLGDPPTLYTRNNVLLGALHLALVLGAARIVVIGLEMDNMLHFYATDPEQRQRVANAYRQVSTSPYLGIDHPYERAVDIVRFMSKPESALSQLPNAFDECDHQATFGAYVDCLRQQGVECISAVEDNVLTRAGAPYAPLGDLLKERGAA